MNRRNTAHGLRLAMFCMAVFACFCNSAHSAVTRDSPKFDSDLHHHPTDGKVPVEVSIGLYVTNLVAIDENRETFEVAGYLVAKWTDPRLALPADRSAKNPSTQDTLRTFRTEDIWTPPIEAANSVAHRTNSSWLEVSRTGEATYIERFDATLSSAYSLRRFPFDTQILQFEFQPFLSSESGVRFADKALPATGISPQENTELSAWRTKQIRYKTEKVAGSVFGPDTHEALFEIVIQRRSAFYLWKIVLPLVILTLIPAIVFWLDVKEFDWMAKVPITMLLSLVAFEFAISRDLPKVGYLTFLDSIFLASFAFFFINIWEIVLVFILQKQGRRTLAAGLHSAGKWAYPLTYFAVLAALGFYFLY
jgi:hypothetical protein